MKVFLFASLVTLGSLTAKAQDFAVTTRGDTIVGKIKILNFGSEKRIQVVGNDNKKSNYPILQVRSFKSNGELFRTVRGPLGYQFMKQLKDGYLSLYLFQMKDQVTYDGLLLSKRDGTYMEVPNLTFKRTLRNYLSECRSVAARIDAGNYERKDIERIVDDFNACVAEEQQPSAEPQPAAAAVTQETPAATLSAWAALEAAVNAKPEFTGKADANEMIADIRAKLSRKEKIPNFLVEGLKTSLKDQGVDKELEAALLEIK
jgi:hypothetical protein